LNISVYLTHPFVASWNFSEAQRLRLERQLADSTVLRCTSEEEFLASLPGAEIVAVWQFEDRWLERAPNLEWLVTPAAGAEGMRFTPRAGLDIEHGSFHGLIMAETVVGILLGHSRGLFQAQRLQRLVEWPRAELAGSMRTLRGARLTILGFGMIGRWIGRLAKPFGVQITGVSRRPGVPPDYFTAGDEWSGLDALDDRLSETEFLILVLPATRETDSLLNERRIALLPSTAVVVNVGRGNAIDERALAAALAGDKLAAAYLDVYSEEPLPSTSPLRGLANVLLLPHVSAIAPQHLDLFVDELAEKYAARYGSS